MSVSYIAPEKVMSREKLCFDGWGKFRFASARAFSWWRRALCDHCCAAENGLKSVYERKGRPSAQQAAPSPVVEKESESRAFDERNLPSSGTTRYRSNG